jgi:hypothetical protein
MHLSAARISEHLVGRTIRSIRLLQNNEPPFLNDGDRIWAVDAGLEFQLDDGWFLFGWDINEELLLPAAVPLVEFSPELEHREVRPEHHTALNDLIGRRITRMVAETVASTTMEDAPLDLFLRLTLFADDRRRLDLACVLDGSITPALDRLIGDVSDRLLITVDHDFEVSYEDHAMLPGD